MAVILKIRLEHIPCLQPTHTVPLQPPAVMLAVELVAGLVWELASVSMALRLTTTLQKSITQVLLLLVVAVEQVDKRIGEELVKEVAWEVSQ